MSFLTMKNDHDPAEPFMAFIQDDITTRAINDIAGMNGWNVNRVFNGGIDQAIETLKEISTPGLLVIDLTGCGDPEGQIMELASVCDAGVRLICLGTTNDVTLYRTLLDMGVEDYLLKPIDPATLGHAIERATEEKEETPVPEAVEEGEVVSVIGALGGIGASSAALNIAWDAAQDKKKRVALVDMDLHFGTVALSLDLEPGKGFREALENPSRIDSLFLDRAMVKVNDTFSILACETDLDITCNFAADALALLVERLRQKYDLVVLDVPRAMLPEFGDLLSKLGKMVVISDLSLAGMRDCLRISRYTKEHMIDDNLVLVANRQGENKERELAPKEFEKGIERELNCIVPFDPKGFAQAEMQGAALVKVAQKSKAAQAMKPIFDLFGDKDDNVEEKPSLWRKLLKGK